LALVAVVSGAISLNGSLSSKAVSGCVEDRIATCLADLAESASVDVKDESTKRDVAKNLGVAGRLTPARRLAQDIADPSDRQFLEDNLALAAVAHAARAHPDIAASLEDIERLGASSAYGPPQGRVISAYKLLVMELVGGRPYDVATITQVNDAIKSSGKQPARDRSATLDAVLLRLAEIARSVIPEQIPARFQSWRFTDVGLAFALAGEVEAARSAFAAATAATQDIQGGWNTTLVRAWLKIDAPADALPIAKQAGERYRALMLGEVARGFRNKGWSKEANEVLAAAWQAAMTDADIRDRLGTLRTLLRLTAEFGETAAAEVRGEDLLRLSAKPGGKHAQGIYAAVLNDLGHHERAREAIQLALGSVHPDEGRLDGIDTGLATRLAIEAYRAGDDATARRLLASLGRGAPGPDLGDMVSSHLDCARTDEELSRVTRLGAGGSEFRLRILLAAECLKRGATASAMNVIEPILAQTSDEAAQLALMDLSRLANAAGRSDLVRRALLRRADYVSNVGDGNLRARLLAETAKLATYLVPDAK
jgi:hypothetical protein